MRSLAGGSGSGSGSSSSSSRRRGRRPDEHLPRQPRFVIRIRLTTIFSHHVIQPPSIRLQLLTRRKLGREVHPGGSITPRPDLIRHALLRVVTHLLVQHRIRPELIKVPGDGRRVAHFDEEPVLAMLHLKWDTAGASCDDRFAFVDRLRDFHFESFTRRELENDLGAGHERVEDCGTLVPDSY